MFFFLSIFQHMLEHVLDARRIVRGPLTNISAYKYERLYGRYRT